MSAESVQEYVRAITRTRSALTPNRATSMLLSWPELVPSKAAACVVVIPERSRSLRSSTPSRVRRAVGAALPAMP